MFALYSALLLSWVLLGLLRAAGSVAVHGHLSHGLRNLAGLEAWNAFFAPPFLRWSVVAVAAAVGCAVLARWAAGKLGASERRRTTAAALAALGSFWLLAALSELLERTPVRDVMTSKIVLSEAQAAILAVGCVAFACTFLAWRALHGHGARALAASATALAIAAGVLAASRLTVADAAAHAAGPSVLLITIDTLRADHLSSYGYPRPTSPRIDALAAGGVLYESSVSQASSTRPSMAAMITSAYPTQFTGRPFKYIPHSMPTLAEVLREAGYRTGAVVSNVWLKDRLGFDQGFEYYDQTSAMSEFYDDTGRIEWKDASHVSDGGIAFLERHAGERFFLWLHYLDPHHPYEPKPPFDTKFAQKRPDHVELVHEMHALDTDEQTEMLVKLGTRELPVSDETFQAILDQYDGEIAYNDLQVGRVLDTLDRLGLARDTLVVLTADHGEEFRDHGRWGHGHTLYEEVIHVPLIVRYPGETGGARVQETVRTIDIAPTVLAVAGLPVPSTMQGADLRTVATRSQRDAVSVCSRSGELSVEVGGWKLITAATNVEGDDAKLFHLADDPRESVNLATKEPQRAADMMALLVDRLGAAAQESIVERITGLDPATRQQLEALGYIH